MSNIEPESSTNAYPSVDLAYDIAIDSYDVAIKRIEWIDGRLQALLTFAATVGAAVLSVGASRGLLHFRSIWFYLAIISFVLATALGFYARFSGTIRVLDPEVFYERWLHFSPWEFKKDLIYFAAEDFQCNMRLSKRLWDLSIVVLILFFLEVVFLVLWVAKAHV
jgi:hypothetical protein